MPKDLKYSIKRTTELQKDDTKQNWQNHNSTRNSGCIKAPDDLMNPYAICFEDAPTGIAITLVGKVLHLNKALLSITGYNKEE